MININLGLFIIITAYAIITDTNSTIRLKKLYFNKMLT